MNTESPDPAELAALRAAFAADGRSDTALGWAGVHAFEAAHGVVLPEPYRTFVAEIADGSPAGPPEYGLVALADLPSDWGAGRPERDLSQPFPLDAAWLWEDDEDTPEDEFDDLVGRVTDHGSIVLGTEGCGMYWHLVVTGPQRGRLWLDTGEGAAPYGGPSEADFGRTTAALGFTDWVTHWAAGRDWFDASTDTDTSTDNAPGTGTDTDD
ncbi:SMI1/KNR4 family protein [Kitasatospora sp. NPDC088134]|uniref:SMI1/KNR4 family protein n=1 Tax=Kitasatospora sp. NPDC088134 TaxID=3364071 RepID=UPI00381F6D15